MRVACWTRPCACRSGPSLASPCQQYVSTNPLFHPQMSFDIDEEVIPGEVVEPVMRTRRPSRPASIRNTHLDFTADGRACSSPQTKLTVVVG